MLRTYLITFLIYFSICGAVGGYVISSFGTPLRLFWNCCPDLCVVATVASKIVYAHFLYHSNK